MKQWLGRYRDPWFGEISICERDGHVKFDAVKSPLMTGDVMRVGERLLVDWESTMDEEPWLTFTAGKPVTLTLAKVDPEGDFSSDYEDLSFTRVGACNPTPAAAPLSDADALSRVDELMSSYTGVSSGRVRAGAARWQAGGAALLWPRRPRTSHARLARY